jgi:site-specific DNA-methyltransferase (adenine-specific)/modification methylase
MPFDEVTIGNARLIHGDCREVLPLLPPGTGIVSDPPYGIGYVHSKGGRGGCLAAVPVDQPGIAYRYFIEWHGGVPH